MGSHKSEKNFAKHGVSFDEASTVFEDVLLITVIDEEHSFDEERYITIGVSNKGRLIMIAHAESKGRIRIISARKATKKEERFYAEAPS